MINATSQLTEYTGNFTFDSIQELNSYAFKSRLINSRLYFYKNPLLFYILKILIGLSTLTIPFINFSYFNVNDINKLNSNFFTESVPFIISSFLCFIYILFLFIYSFYSIVCDTSTK